MNKKGFTLVELLVVVAVITILATALLVGFGGARARGRDARRVSDMRNVQNILELYYAKNGYYPNVTTGDCPTRWTALTNAVTGAGVATKLPTDPLPGHEQYCYASSAASVSQNYTLRAKLENDDHAALNDDIDGTSNGIGCDDPYYCVVMY